MTSFGHGCRVARRTARPALVTEVAAIIRHDGAGATPWQP
jgi:hypothetical protein